MSSSPEFSSGKEDAENFSFQETELKSPESNENKSEEIEKAQESLGKEQEKYQQLNWFQKLARNAQKFVVKTYFGTLAAPSKENKMFFEALNDPKNRDKSVKEIDRQVQVKYEENYIKDSLTELPEAYQRVMDKLSDLDWDISKKKYQSILKMEKDLTKWQDNLKDVMEGKIEVGEHFDNARKIVKEIDELKTVISSKLVRAEESYSEKSEELSKEYDEIEGLFFDLNDEKLKMGKYKTRKPEPSKIEPSDEEFEDIRREMEETFRTIRETVPPMSSKDLTFNKFMEELNADMPTPRAIAPDVPERVARRKERVEEMVGKSKEKLEQIRSI